MFTAGVRDKDLVRVGHGDIAIIEQSYIYEEVRDGKTEDLIWD